MEATSIQNTYIYKLIDRATANVLFENNQIGNYIIKPQHGINVFIYHIYKIIKGQKIHILTVYITESIFIKTLNKLTKKEIKTLVHFFLNNYKSKSLVLKETF